MTHGQRIGAAWIAMWAALAVHVFDEAVTGFLAVYNPTVLALRQRFAFFPMPTFDFQTWLAGLVTLVCVMLALSPFAFRNRPWIRALLYFAAIVIGIANAAGHIAGTIAGQTVDTVRFARPAPGFWSSPVLLAAAIFALAQLRRTRAVMR